MKLSTARLICEMISEPPSLDAALAAVASSESPVILDSSASDSRYGRYVILACEPVEVCSWPWGGVVNALDAFERLIRETPSIVRSQADSRNLPFVGGWMGYIGYEAGRWIERLPHRTGNHPLLPTMWFALFDTAAVYDRIADRWWLLAVDWPDDGRLRSRPPASVRLSRLRAKLSSGCDNVVSSSKGTSSLKADFTRDQYEDAVRCAIEYIAAGDIFQVNLSQRFVCRSLRSPFEVFTALRRDNPSCYGAYLRVGETTLVSASPELFLDLRDGVVVTRPIKGTRKRYNDPAMDRAMREELLASAKDAAELAMIIDLERNDLGRVCEYGTIRVAEARAIEQHPTVYHLVGTVTGRLRAGLGVVDLLRATFPGGSITGAPKIRAMQIIDELEPVPRGVYCGSIGYIGLDGSAVFNIAIRTITMGPDYAEVHAGGGIVADSTPSGEYEETLAKAAALLQALGTTNTEVSAICTAS